MKQKLTVRLPKESLEFAKRYAEEHRVTVTALIDRYLRRLESTGQRGLHPAVVGLTGLIPSDVDARGEHRQAQLRKHR